MTTVMSTVSDLGNGTYVASYTPMMAGVYDVNVRLTTGEKRHIMHV